MIANRSLQQYKPPSLSLSIGLHTNISMEAVSQSVEEISGQYVARMQADVNRLTEQSR